MLEKKIYTINVFPGLNDAKIIVTLGSVGRRLLSWRVGNHFDNINSELFRVEQIKRESPFEIHNFARIPR